ncbi:MAG: methanol dehydrogenase [Thermoleophilia bacterium]|nr:methanol dehydrogenase [Thermoleophilia bacterium]
MTVAFHASQATQVVAGADLVALLGDYVVSYGTRALLVVGDGHARRTGLLARAEGALRAAGVALEGIEGVPPNPTTATVDAGAALARAWRADVVVGIGGGSVIDVAKAIATAAADPAAAPFRTHLSGIRSASLLITDALPVVALPTLPGSGSETNGTSVITDEESGRKLSASSDLAAPRCALLDVDLLAHAPAALLAPGLVDAWCHALEAMLSENANVASDALAEQAFTLLDRHTDVALDEQRPFGERREALLACWWATNLAGQALGMAGSVITHPLAHPLSARLDVRHGVAVAALEAAVVACCAERFLSGGGLQRAARAYGVRSWEKPDAALRGVLDRLSRYCAMAEVGTGAAALGLDDAGLDIVVRDARHSGSRGLANMPGGEPAADELYAVLDLARAMSPVTTTKRVLELRDSQRVARAAVGS